MIVSANNIEFWSVILQSTLILGYGNPDREDDGVAWHILRKIADQLGKPLPESYQDSFFSNERTPDFLFVLQLTPELAENIAEYERVCFVDAHTGALAEDLNIQQVDAHFQSSPLTHHMTAQTLISFVNTLYNKRINALLVSVRGYQFRFMTSLSDATSTLAEQAAAAIIQWLHEE